MKAIALQKIVQALQAANLIEAIHGSIESSQIADIAYDSRQVVAGTLFCCKGARFKGTFIIDARAAGAVAFLAEEAYPEAGDLPLVQVRDMRQAMAVAANVFFDQPWQKLTMIGVTGTKGKSTTVTLLKAIFDAAAQATGEKPAGITSSLRVYDGQVDRPATLTTPESIDLYRHLYHAVEAGLQYMIVEVSSQALKYARVGEIGFEHGVFLNIAPDHISPIEHPDFDDYFASKRQLFRQSQHVYLNLNSDFIDTLVLAAQTSHQISTFAMDGTADYSATSIEAVADGLRFELYTPQGKLAIQLPLHGRFNVENALAAVAVADACGVPMPIIQNAFTTVTMPGHMVYLKGTDLTVIVDFAHNEISFEKVFATAKTDFPQAHITAVFGSAGGKAESRRPGMGRVASLGADRIFLTADDPANEAVAAINAEIRAAYVQAVPTCELADRLEAITAAICSAPAGGVVLLLGKGNEDRQKVGDGSEPYQGDEAIAQAALAKRKQVGILSFDDFSGQNASAQ